MKVVDILSENNWITNTLAETKRGTIVPATHTNAVKFSLVGAVIHCYPNKVEKVLSVIENYIGENIFTWESKSSFNEIQQLIKELGL